MVLEHLEWNANVIKKVNMFTLKTILLEFDGFVYPMDKEKAVIGGWIAFILQLLFQHDLMF